MITADAAARDARLAELRAALEKEAPPEEKALLATFAGLVAEELPDRLVLGLPPAALAARIRAQFRFVVHEMPPPNQLYKGLPGIHVSARTLSGDDAASQGGGAVFPAETTVVQIHTPDAPFILESLKNYFRKRGLRIFSSFGLILTTRRQWERIVWIGGPREEATREAFCYFQIERLPSPEALRRVEHEIHAVLKSVITAVEDYQSMVAATRGLAGRLKSRRGKPEDVTAATAFLHWLLQDNYIFMGTVRYRRRSDGLVLRVQDSATGVFTDPDLLPVVFPGLMDEVEGQMDPKADDHRIVDIDYCHNASALYHLEPIDDVVVREWADDGTLVEVTLLLGRLSAGAFAQRAGEIPLLKEKQDWLLEHSGDVTNSHIYREIRAVFNRFPKRELFYANVRALKEIIDRIVFVTSDEEVVTHVRKGSGYVALYVAFSRLRYSYRVEEDLRQQLAREFGAISFGTSADLGAVTLLVFYFDESKLQADVDPAGVYRYVVDLVTTWEDQATNTLVSVYGEAQGRALYKKYQDSLSGLYREATQPDEVPDDLARLEALQGRLETRILSRGPQSARLKLYSTRALGLSGAIRTLQNLGLTVAEELRVPLTLPEGQAAYLYRFDVEAPSERIVALTLGRDRFAHALRALDDEWATDDPLNGLVLDAALTWREVEVIRTLRNHLLQIRPHYNADTVNGVLLRNALVTQALFRSFATRFDPGLPMERTEPIEKADAAVQKALESVRSLAEDEVLRAIDNLIRAALRTNFYQRPERPVVSIKVECKKVEGMPSPRPLFEVYVHSRLLEGIHLRGGRVARGGIRWSDRHDDFRTEILGLMKTQMVKNSIIVPVGSKGGFVLKGEVPARPALDAYLIARYREYVSGLLDVTDNLAGGGVLHPPEVVRHDGPDPYLVVAADKGTAHLSDTANMVSNQYGFWLGDAFASGGKNGYDHKKVGITARGAWECVKHHFRNLGVDVQSQPFTVAGLGDMSGDVFGNGALQSRAIRLVAAFNHAHIFIDPDPDPAKSYVERERLFRLPRSTWRDYDAGLISKGGGIFDRSAKAIPLSPEIRKLLDIEGESASGEEVVRRILTARVDLLYNGGIGTYVKASFEEDADVGDRANDRVRVNGKDVRARVIAEGGNLGLTQPGRLEYWAAGGLLNTDAVDNSGGVDMSDHEVNIKIFMDVLLKKGLVAGREERNKLLAEMTEEVAALVLKDNADQSWAITLGSLRSVGRYDAYVGLVEHLLADRILNREDDAVPSRKDLLEAPTRERGLPRPLLAVMLGQGKRWAYDRMLETTFADTPAGAPFLHAYFPKRLQESFAQHFADHALRREIIATAAVNHFVNNAGVAFCHQLVAQEKRGIDAVVTAYLAAEARVDAAAVRVRVHEGTLDARGRTEALVALEDALAALTRDALEGKGSDVDALMGPVRERIG